MRGVLGVAVAFVVMSGATAPPAHAYKAWSTFSAAEKESVFQWLLCADPAKPVCPNEGPVGDATAQRLWQGEKALTIKVNPTVGSPTPPAARASYGRFHQMMWQARQGAGMLPKWGRAFLSAGGAVTGVLSVGYLGLNVGSFANNRFFRFGMGTNDVTFPGISSATLQPLDKGQNLPGEGILQPGGGYTPVPSPIEGFYVQVNRAGTNYSFWSESDQCEGLPPEYGGPEGFQAITSGVSRCLLGYTPPPFVEPIYGPYESSANIGRTPGLPLGPPTHDASETGEGTLPGTESIRNISDAPGITDTAKRAALDTYMNDESDHFADLMREWMDFTMDPDSDPADNPVIPRGTIPDCQTLSLNACIEALQAAGFGVYVAEELSFEDAEPIPQAQAAEVKRTVPAGGTTAVLDDEVVIEHNPIDDDDMPRVVPPPISAEDSASGEGESEEEYRERMAGFPYFFDMESPASDPTHLTDISLDPEFGPDSVVGSSPAPGSRAHKGDPVSPRVNPPTAPSVAVPPGGGGCEPWASPSINFSPLAGLGVATVFPFAVPFWIFDALEEWVGGPVTPSWDFHFPFAGEGENWHVDLTMFDPYMPQIRVVLLAASLLAMAWFFLSLAMGAPSSRSDPE